MNVDRGKQCDASINSSVSSSVVAASHELKSPLALIRQLSLSIADNHTPDDEKQKLAEQITLTTERAIRLTNGLTQVSRLQKDFFELEPVNIMRVCQEVTDELFPFFEQYNVSVRVRPRSRSLLALANSDLLKNIIINFIENAVHYSANSKPIEVKMSLIEKGKKVRISIRDYGPTLRKGFWRQLRKQLGSVPQPISSRPMSSGLGLYISGQFAEAMDGRIGMTRHRDGATFYVDIVASQQLALL